MIAPMHSRLEQARDFFLAGVRHYQKGNFERAQAQFTASLALVPGRTSTLTNLGATRLKLGRMQDAIDVLTEVLDREPHNVDALGHCAAAHAELGHSEQALALLERALAADPSLATAWVLRGTLLREAGRAQEAARSYERARACGADGELMGYYLAALQGDGAPPTAPRAYVQGLFDGYAQGFEDHLLQVLRYQAPQRLLEGLGDSHRFARALDLGCGTGLCGVLLRDRVDRLVGVDLSANMVRQARLRNVYDEVLEADLAHYLAASHETCDLVVAADVFIYVGALEAVFEGVARVLAKGGTFCFCVERDDEDRGEGFLLSQSRRYAHALRYIRKLAEQNGFEIRHTADHPIRDDQEKPIVGLYAWLIKR